MGLRYWLMSLLADGDAVIMNMEVMRNGALRRKELGGLALLNVQVAAPRQGDYAVLFEGMTSGNPASLRIESGNSRIVLQQGSVK